MKQEDWQNVTDLAKKEVATQKQTKKLRQERDELKEKLSEVTSELEEYKKREEEARHFSRKKLNAESQRITREEQLTRSLQKAMAVIDAHGLRDEYDKINAISILRKNELE